MYAYKEAQVILDEFALKQLDMGNDQFFRSYRKLLGVLLVYAQVDFGTAKGSFEEKLAWAWEDADIAFRGYGENLISGAAIQLWSVLPSPYHNALRKTLKKAMRAAWASTPASHRPRWSKEWREKPICMGEDSFNDMPYALPTWGPKLREEAEAQGFDAFATEAQYRKLAEEEAELLAEAEEVRKESQARQALKLVHQSEGV